MERQPGTRLIINLHINHTPIAKARPRFSKVNGKSRTYDTQSSTMKGLKWHFAKQIREQGALKITDGAIYVHMRFYTTIPKSWSKKRSKEAEEFLIPVVTRPDVDNYFKFYSDILNGIAYHDDSQIFSCLCEKFYSSKPRVEIKILSSEDIMIKEHAKTIKDNINIPDLDYMIKKANDLGKSGRKISRVFSEEDAEGTHIYFEVQGLRFAQRV